MLTNVHCTYNWKILMFAFATGCALQLWMGLSLFLVQGALVVLLLVLCNLTLDFGENSESLESSDFKVIGSGLQEELSKCTMGFALGKQEKDNISAFILFMEVQLLQTKYLKNTFTLLTKGLAPLTS